MPVVLKPQVFLAAVSASTNSPWIPVDVNHDGQILRSISGTKVSGNAIQVEVRTSANVQASNGLITGYSIIATATTWNSASVGPISAIIQGPFSDIRVRQIGSSGVSTVVGYV